MPFLRHRQRPISAITFGRWIVPSRRTWVPQFTDSIVLIVRTTAPNETFLWPDRGGTYDCHIDWGDGSEANYTAAPSAHTYATVGDYEIAVTGTAPAPYFNNVGDRLKLVGGALNGTACGATDFGAAFYGCSSLTALDTSGWDISSVTNFGAAFRDCSGLTALDTSGWDTSSVTNFSGAFRGCSGLTALDTSGWDISSVTNFGYAFYGCSSLTALDASNWDTSSATSFSYAFYGCFSLTALDASNWDTSSVTDFSDTFRVCFSLTALDTSGWDISSVTDFSGAFYGCSSLTQASVDSFLVAAYNSRATMPWATPTVELPTAPSGTYQDPSPDAPSTGKEYEYILENDPNGEGFNMWSVTY